MGQRTETEEQFLEFAKGLEQADLVAMLTDWVDFKELPQDCMTQSLKRQFLPQHETATS